MTQTRTRTRKSTKGFTKGFTERMHQRIHKSIHKGIHKRSHTMIQKKDSRKCSQQRDNPDNSGTPRTMAGQHRDNSGTIPTTTTDAIATISNLFPLLTARCLPQHLDNSGPPARRAAPTTVRGASPPTPFAGRAWRKSLAEHGLYDRRCGIYSCCLRSARKHEETQKRSSQEPPKRTPSFHSTTAAPTVTRADRSRSPSTRRRQAGRRSSPPTYASPAGTRWRLRENTHRRARGAARSSS